MKKYITLLIVSYLLLLTSGYAQQINYVDSSTTINACGASEDFRIRINTNNTDTLYLTLVLEDGIELD